ncbi:MAG TPA: DUF1465 family protein [Rhodospirillaceae bacterium]|nr:DUF1465 family protein [Rhodospirillaceae bacterium]
MDQQPLIFSRTYDETLKMIVEARNYMAHMEPRRQRRFSGIGELRLSCEALRVTSRLTQVMAWLMLHRAVQCGEISLQDACQECHRLSGRDVCLDTSAVSESNIPSGLRSLLERSYSLYQRVSRLEEMVLTRAFTN